MLFNGLQNVVRFEIGGVVVAHVTRRRRTYHMIRVVSERRYTIQRQQIIKVVQQPSRWPRRQGRRKYEELFYANLRRKKVPDMPA